MFTAAQVAEKLGVSKRRVLALISEKRLRAKLVGVQYLVDPSDLARLRILKTGRPRKS